MGLAALLAFAVCVISALGSPDPHAAETLTVQELLTVPVDHYLFVYVVDDACGKQCHSMTYDYLVAAEVLRHHAHLRVGVINIDHHPEAAGVLGLDDGIHKAPHFVLITGRKKDRVHHYDGLHYESSLYSFVAKEAGEKIQPSDVQYISSNMFDHIAHHEQKHAFIEFYERDNEDVHELVPTMEHVATAFHGEHHVIVGKIDLGQYPEFRARFDIDEVPTLMYFPAEVELGDDDGEVYFGAKTASAIVEFLNKKAMTYRHAVEDMDDTTGRIQEFDKLVKGFAHLSGPEQDTVWEALKAKMPAVDSHEKRIAETYLHLTTHAYATGMAHEYLSKEHSRVATKLGKIQRGDPVYAYYHIRLNILDVLLADRASSPGAITRDDEL
jgi:thioredoxin-like negative regulator of GroEL